MTTFAEIDALLVRLGYQPDDSETTTILRGIALEIETQAGRVAAAANELAELTGHGAKAVLARQTSVMPGSRFVLAAGEHQTAVARYEQAMKGLSTAIKLAKASKED